MKLLIAFIMICISLPAFCSCQKWELKGWVKKQGYDLHLVVAEKTMSQKKLPVYFEASPKLAPYINRYVVVNVEIKDPDLKSTSEIRKIFSVKEDVPDPLNQNAKSEMKCLK